jgi:hypothetical protein
MPQDLLARLEPAGDGERFKTLAEEAKREYAPEQEPKDA